MKGKKYHLPSLLKNGTPEKEKLRKIAKDNGVSMQFVCEELLLQFGEKLVIL